MLNLNLKKMKDLVKFAIIGAVTAVSTVLTIKLGEKLGDKLSDGVDKLTKDKDNGSAD